MTLSMTRPSKHPKSGIYWFRKRVPDDLRNLIGKREERFSLDTRDPNEAKRRHALKLAEVEERWSNLRAGQRPLSPDDIARLNDLNLLHVVNEEVEAGFAAAARGSWSVDRVQGPGERHSPADDGAAESKIDD